MRPSICRPLLARLLPVMAGLAVATCGVLSGTPCLAAPAGQTSVAQVKAQGELRVCIWPDYQGITYRDPRSGQLSGLDFEVAQGLAKLFGVAPRWVSTSFKSLAEDLRQDRCDVAMFAIAMLPTRMQDMRFTQPYMHSDLVAVVPRRNEMLRQWKDIDQPGVRVGVLAGTFMEPVMRARLRKADLIVLAAPQTREQELEAGRIDVFISDEPYTRTLQRRADWVRVVKSDTPVHPLPYAYAVKTGDDRWVKELNDALKQLRQQGLFKAAAAHHGMEDLLQSP